MSGELSVEDLYDLSDDKLISIIKESLVSQLKNSSSVKPVFFPNASSPQIPVPDDATPMNCIGSITQIDWVATALVCSSLARTSLYGFNQTVDLAKSDALWGDWFKNQSPIYTRNLYFSYFDRYCQNSSGTTFFIDYLHDSPGLWSQKLAEHVTTNEFINETIAKLIASEPNWLVKINLILYKLYRLDPAQKNIVLAKWQSAYSNIQEIWSTYDYVGDAFITATLFFQDVQAAVTVATDDQSRAPIDCPGTFYIPTDETTYGVAVVGFLNGSPNSLGLYTHANPNNYIRSGGASCFVGSTSIRLSDMQSKVIKSVTSGDWVLTANHQVAMVSDERVMTRFKKPILIYGFNNVRPFFTAGHCFWTDGGWKAVDPAIALQENHQLVVSRLAVGDHVLKLTADIGQSTKHQQWVRIRSLNQAILPAGYPVYGLHLVDGHHSYYANDFLVRMNYPILTEAKFSHGFSLLSASERQFVHQQLRPIMPLLKKSLGEHIEQPLLRAITQQGSDFHHDNLSDRDLFRKSKDTLYHLYVLDHNTCLYTSRHNLAKELRISHGNVFYDGMHIKNVLFDHESIRWSEQHGDRYSSAVLFYRDADLSLSGTLFYGPTSSKAIAHEVFLGIPPSIYTTKISKKSVSVLPDNLDIQSDGPFEQGPSFSLGFVEPDVSKNSQIPTIEFKLKTELNSDWADLSNFVLFSTNPKTNNLVISFDPKNPDFYSLITEGVNQYGETFPGAGRLEFSWDACCLSGYFCPAYTTNIFSYWAGNLVPSLSPDFAVGLDFSNFTIATGELELSVADLFTLSADQTNLQKTSNDFLIENMKWHLGKYHPDYLTNFFGEIQPLIPDDRISEISQSYDFYEDFANAYVCNGVGSFASSPLNGDEQSRLKNFFENGLAKNTSYSIQSRCLLKHSYMRNIPRISDYLLDGGEKWARLLFNELMTQQSINRFVTQIIASNNFDVCNKYATLLNILDPKSQLDAEFIQILNIHSGREISYKYLFPVDRTKALLPVFLDAFIGFYKSPDSSIIDNLKLIDREMLLAVLPNLLCQYASQSQFSTARKIRDNISVNYPSLAAINSLLNLIVLFFSMHDGLLSMYQWNDLNKDQLNDLVVSQLEVYSGLWSLMPKILSSDDILFNEIIKIKNYLSSPEVINQYKSIIIDFYSRNALTKTLKSVNYTSGDLETWLPDLIQIFLNEIEKNPDSSISKNIQIQKLADDLKKILEVTHSASLLASTLIDLLNASYGPKISLTFNETINYIVTKFPKLASVAKNFARCVKSIAWIVGLYFVISDFKAWKSLSDADKASLVINTVSLFVKLLDAIPDLISIAGKSSAGLADKIRWLSNKLFNKSSAYDLSIAEIEVVDIADMEGEGAYLYDLIDFSHAVIDDAAIMDGIFSDMSKMMGWFAPLAAGAIAGLNLYHFIDDIKSGATVKQQAFDGIVAVSSILETVCLVGELLEVSVVFGPAAVVFALLGVIFSLVELFDPSSPPESPVDKFMDSMRSSFLPSLPRPDPSSNNSKAINFGQQHCLFKLGVESPSKVLLIDGCKDHDKNRENEAELILMRLHHIRASISFTLKNNPAQLPALLDYMSSDMELLMNQLNSYSRSVSYEI